MTGSQALHDPSVPGYAAAQGYQTAHRAVQPAAPPGPRSLRGLGWFTALLLGIHGVVAVVTAGVSAWQVLQWSGMSDVEGDLRLPSDGVRLALVLASLPLTVITGAVFIAWLYVAASNAERFGSVLSRAPGWAVAGWFVPVLNLWRPKQVLDDVWRASIPGVPPGIDLRRLPSSAMVAWWWAAYLLAGILPSVGAVRALSPALGSHVRSVIDGTPPVVPVAVDTARFNESVALWGLWSAVLLVVAAGLAATIVVKVTSWQHQRSIAAAAR